MTNFIFIYFILILNFSWVIGKLYATFTTTRPTAQSTLVTNSYKNISSSLQAIRLGGDIVIDLTSANIKGLDEQFKLGCKKINMRRYIGRKDRNCRSTKPIKFAACGGFCLPQQYLNRPKSNFEALVQTNKHNYKCVAARTVRRRVKVHCKDDKSLTIYTAIITKACKCQQVQDRSTQKKINISDEKYIEPKNTNGNDENNNNDNDIMDVEEKTENETLLNNKDRSSDMSFEKRLSLV